MRQFYTASPRSITTTVGTQAAPRSLLILNNSILRTGRNSIGPSFGSLYKVKSSADWVFSTDSDCLSVKIVSPFTPGKLILIINFNEAELVPRNSRPAGETGEEGKVGSLWKKAKKTDGAGGVTGGLSSRLQLLMEHQKLVGGWHNSAVHSGQAGMNCKEFWMGNMFGLSLVSHHLYQNYHKVRLPEICYCTFTSVTPFLQQWSGLQQNKGGHYIQSYLVCSLLAFLSRPARSTPPLYQTDQIFKYNEATIMQGVASCMKQM